MDICLIIVSFIGRSLVFGQSSPIFQDFQMVAYYSTVEEIWETENPVVSHALTVGLYPHQICWGLFE